MNTPPEPADYAARLRDSAARLMAACDPYQLLRYQDFGGSPADKAAGTEWLKRRVPIARPRTCWSAPAFTARSSRSSRNWRGPAR